MKPLAPQGEWLKQRILAGSPREIGIIFMGFHAEHKARSFLPILPCTMYLPHSASPYGYSWPVHGCEIYLVDTGGSQSSFIRTFAMHLFTNGAEQVNYLSSKTNYRFTRSNHE